MATTEPIRDKVQLKKLVDFYLQKGQFRNYTLIIMGIYTALRISDLLQLKWVDVYDKQKQMFYHHITITEKKTGKTKTIALNKHVLETLHLYFPHHYGEFIFASSRDHSHAISRVQAWRIVHTAVVEVGISDKIACHSLRKTWGYHAWTNGSVSPVVIMDIYNHSNYDTTRRYLGVAQDDLDKAYLEINLL